MTFGISLGEHLTMAAFANMFYIIIDYMNKSKYESSNQIHKH